MNTHQFAELVKSIPQLDEPRPGTPGEEAHVASIYIKPRDGAPEWVSGATFQANYGPDGSILSYVITLEGSGGQ